jgi:hypothetical protein
MVNSSVGEKNRKDLAYVLAILLVMVAIGSGAISTTDIVATKKSSSSLTQMPSEPTDFPDNNEKAIEVHVTNAKKDIIGAYHVRGEIKNISNDTLQFVQVTAHFYDESGQPVGATTCCYAQPTDIDPGHTSTFDSFVMKDAISGKPTSYRLSFDWN